MSIERSVKINGAKYFSYLKDGEWKNDPLEQQSMFTRTFLPEGTEVKEYDNVSDMVTEIVGASDLAVPDLPTSGELKEGDLYNWSGMVVRVRQTHNRTGHYPTNVPALFSIYRKESEDMEWIEGEQVDVGVVRLYEDIKYECISEHQTQIDWTPDVAITLWEIYDEPGDEYPVYKPVTGAHDVYMKDDIVWYPALDDTLYISTIDNNSWAPGVYGWIEYTEI